MSSSQVGITLNVNWGEPRDASNDDDLIASDNFMQFQLGWYAHPIFVDGKYPEVSNLSCVRLQPSFISHALLIKTTLGDEK